MWGCGGIWYTRWPQKPLRLCSRAGSIPAIPTKYQRRIRMSWITTVVGISCIWLGYKILADRFDWHIERICGTKQDKKD